MMPYCEYKKCKKVATTKSKLLRKWDSWHFRDKPTHNQEIWLCEKHDKKINDLLQIGAYYDD